MIIFLLILKYSQDFLAHKHYDTIIGTKVSMGRYIEMFALISHSIGWKSDSV